MEAHRSHPNPTPEPPKNDSIQRERAVTLFEVPTDVEAPDLIAKAEPSHPAEEARFNCLIVRSGFFKDDCLTIGEGWNVDEPVNRKLCLFGYR